MMLQCVVMLPWQPEYASVWVTSKRNHLTTPLQLQRLEALVAETLSTGWSTYPQSQPTVTSHDTQRPRDDQPQDDLAAGESATCKRATAIYMRRSEWCLPTAGVAAMQHLQQLPGQLLLQVAQSLEPLAALRIQQALLQASAGHGAALVQYSPRCCCYNVALQRRHGWKVLRKYS